MEEITTSAPHSAASISAIAATASVASWMIEHEVLFTIAAAITAVVSGVTAIIFYGISIYYKIKHENRAQADTKVVKTEITVTSQKEQP